MTMPSARTSLTWMLGIAVALVLAHGIFAMALAAGPQWARWFDLDQERNVPTAYSLLLLLAAAAGAAACLREETRLGLARGRDRLAWWCVCLLFFGLAIEEVGSLHERVSSNASLVPVLDRVFGAAASTVRDWFGRGHRSSWIVFYAPLILIAVLALQGFVSSRFAHDATSRRRARTALALYVAVIGLEAASKPLRDQPGIVEVLVVAEEFCEMAGSALFAHVFHRHWLGLRSRRAAAAGAA
jgi:hypothetical protein